MLSFCLLYGEIETEGMLLESLASQSALIEEAVFSRLQFVGEGHLKRAVVDFVDLILLFS
jgi:hypothetical protein